MEEGPAVPGGDDGEQQLGELPDAGDGVEVRLPQRPHRQRRADEGEQHRRAERPPHATGHATEPLLSMNILPVVLNSA